MNNELKLEINGTEYELIQEEIHTYVSPAFPLVYFNDKRYYGKAIPKEASKLPVEDWEIITATDKLGCTTSGIITKQVLARPDFYTIKTVRIISTGEVFSIDDITNEGTITKFEILDGDMFVSFTKDNFPYTNISFGRTSLDRIQKAKLPVKPLFVDADGKEIFANQKFWYIGDAWNICESSLLENELWAIKLQPKTFSTEAAAKTFVRDNKKLFSVNDIIGLCESVQFHNRIHDRADEDCYVVYTSLLETRLKELAKIKINQ